MGQGNLGEARGKISIDARALDAVRASVQRAAQDVEREFGRINAAAGNTERSFGALGNAARSLGPFIASYLTVSTVKLGIEMARTAARADQMGQRFQFLAKIAGQSADEMLVAMRRASRGHIADVDLMFAANRAMLLGVADNMEKIETLMRIAGARAGAMGLSFNQAFDDMVVGIGRLSPRILDNLGIIISANQVYDTYAKQIGKTSSQLTEAQQRQAFYNAVVEQSRDLVNQHTSAGVSNAGRLQQMAAAADNARVAFGDLIQDDVIWWAQRTTEAFEYLQRQMEELQASAGIGARWSDIFAMATGGRTEFVIKDEIRAAIADLERLAQARRAAVEMGDYNALPILTQQMAELRREVERLNVELERFGTSAMPGISIGAPRLGPSGFGAAAAVSAVGSEVDTAALRTAQRDYWQAVQDIERGANQARLDTTRQYEQQRVDAIRAYGLSIAREEEDHQRNRARRVAQHEEGIARIRSDAAAREGQWAADHAARIADMREQLARRQADAQEDHDRRIAAQRENGARRLADLEQQTQRDRERAMRQHRDTLLNAAANLDARAVAQEMRRWSTAQQEQEQQLNERMQGERRSLQERVSQEEEEFALRRARENRDLGLRVAQEQAAHAKRIADARAADEQRIADQQVAFEEQQAQEDEDRAIRLDRQAADHAAQLAQMERAQGERLAQISRQQGEQRAALDTAFGHQLADLGMHNTAWRRLEGERMADSLRLYRKYWDDWNEVMEEQITNVNRPGINPPFMLDPTLPTGVLAPSSSTTNNSTRSITVAPGAVVVQAMPGMNEEMLGDVVGRELLRVLEGISQ